MVDTIIRLPGTKESASSLRPKMWAAGCPKDLYHIGPFKLEKSCKTFVVDPENDKKKVRRFPAPQQLLEFKPLLAHPLKDKNYICCISSYPNDSRAKLTAANLVAAAIRYIEYCGSNGKSVPPPPIWHHVGVHPYYDRLLRTKVPCSLLVLGGVINIGSDGKFDKLRDLLELYHDIPRIVVTSSQNPVAFFNDNLKLALHFALYLGPDETII